MLLGCSYPQILSITRKIPRGNSIQSSADASGKAQKLAELQKNKSHRPKEIKAILNNAMKLICALPKKLRRFG